LHVARQRCAFFNGATGDVGTDVAAEQVPQPFPLGEPRDHLVEPALQSPDFRALIDADPGVESPLFDLGHRVDDLTNRIRNRP